MRATTILLMFFTSFCLAQQHSAKQSGKVYGTKPDTTAIIKATNLEAFMDKKTRITIAIKGKVLAVTKTKGGWFNIDGGNGKIIAAHFSDYNITIPTSLKGKYVIAQGVAAKQFIADDGQHFAGDTVKGKKQHTVNANAKRKLTFEVKGMMVSPPAP